MQQKWQRLHLQKKEGLPPLLFKYISTSKGYEMYITDLTQLWSEQLSYRQVLKRAEEDDTTIDPSEDAEQYNVLLQKVNEALRSSPGSRTTLASGSRADSLELTLSTKLPDPLKPLKWKLYLLKEPHTASTSHLLLPLLREEMDRESRQRTLLEQIKQKDWVLAKLFDKIETMGIDLSTVFPGISGLRGRKETSLAQAGRYIKGVAPFDEKAWFDDFNKSSPESGLTANLLGEIAGPDFSLDPGRLNPPPDKWWESLEARGTAAVTPEQEEIEERPASKVIKNHKKMDIGIASEDDDDEFERQETPPKFKQKKPPKKELSVSDEPEQEQPPIRKKKSPFPSPQKVQQKASKGLGKIGGGKGKQPSTKKPSPSPPPSPPPAKAVAPAAEESTASSPDLDNPVSEPAMPPSATRSDQETDPSASGQKDEDDDHLPSLSPSPQSPSPSPPMPREPVQKKPRGGGLGLIGGKKKGQRRELTPTLPAVSSSPPPEQSSKQDEPASSSPPPPSPQQQPGPGSKPKRTGKLGVIGGKPKSTTTTTKTEKEDEPVKLKSDSKKPARPPSPPGIGIRPKKEEEEEEEVKAPTKAKSKESEPEPEPERDETEQEKADRKREELKRQLEAKSKAPVKKKRKF